MSTIAATNLKNASSATNNIVLNADGTTSITFPSNMIKSGTAQASTSGTAIDFTGLPSWVKRITVVFDGVSTGGTSTVMVRLGSGTFASSGYTSGTTGCFGSGTAGANYTTGFGTDAGGNTLAIASIRHGLLTIVNITGNTWVASGVMGFSNGQFTTQIGGTVSLSGTLDRVRVTTALGDAFDAGTINILYEG
jgi:hypothetical protein